MNRAKFSKYILLYSGCLSAPVFLIMAAINLQSGVVEIFRLFIFLIVPVCLASITSAQLFYGAVTRKLANDDKPWAQCLGIVIVSYPICSLLIILVGVLVYPSNFRLSEHLFEGFLLWLFYPFMFTFWVTIPLGFAIATHLKSSNNSLKNDAEKRAF